MLATLSPEVVTGPEWVFEEKYDGIRAIATRQAGAVRVDSMAVDEVPCRCALARRLRQARGLSVPEGDVRRERRRVGGDLDLRGGVGQPSHLDRDGGHRKDREEPHR